MAAECSSKSHCYILKKTTQGEKDVTAGLNSDNSNDNGYHKILSLMGIERTNVEVSRGEFVKTVPTASTPYTQAHKYHIMRDPTISFSCPQSNVAALALQEYEFLNRSEVVPERRFTLYEYILKEPELLEVSKRCNVRQPPPRKRPASFAPKVGSTVVVSGYGLYASSYYGVVRWIGQFDGQVEKMAGIELTCATLWCMVVVMFLASSLLCPVLCYLWIHAGSANANFFFAMTLTYSLAQIFLHGG